MRFRRGRPAKASRYALRASRSVVVSLSLSRRNAASESKKTPAAGRSSQNHASLTSYIYWLTVRGGTPFGRPLRSPDWGIFLRAESYSKRCCQFEFIAAQRRIRRGRPVKAARYALRASRSVVVSLSLSRRNAASESKKTPAAGRSSQNHASLTSYIYWLTVRGGTPFRTSPTQPQGHFKHGKGLSHGDKPFQYWYWVGKRING